MSVGKAAPVAPPREPGLARLSPLWGGELAGTAGQWIEDDPTFWEVWDRLRGAA